MENYPSQSSPTDFSEEPYFGRVSLEAEYDDTPNESGFYAFKSKGSLGPSNVRSKASRSIGSLTPPEAQYSGYHVREFGANVRYIESASHWKPKDDNIQDYMALPDSPTSTKCHEVKVYYYGIKPNDVKIIRFTTSNGVSLGMNFNVASVDPGGVDVTPFSIDPSIHLPYSVRFGEPSLLGDSEVLLNLAVGADGSVAAILGPLNELHQVRRDNTLDSGTHIFSTFITGAGDNLTRSSDGGFLIHGNQ